MLSQWVFDLFFHDVRYKKEAAVRDFHNNIGTISLDYSTFCCHKHERHFAKFYDRFT